MEQQVADRRPLATVEQVAEYCGVPIATVYQWSYRKTGPRTLKVGRYLRYRWSDVDTWLDQQAGRVA